MDHSVALIFLCFITVAAIHPPNYKWNVVDLDGCYECNESVQGIYYFWIKETHLVLLSIILYKDQKYL
jgi:hypothetical protein